MQNNPNPFDPTPNPTPQEPYSPPPPTSPPPASPPPASPYGGPLEPSASPYGGPAAPPPPYSPGGMPPYSPPPSSGRAGTVSLDSIGEAWKYLQTSLGIWVVAVLIVGIIGFAVSQISNLVFLGSTSFSRDPNRAPNIGGAVLASIPGIIVNTVLYAGLIKMAIQQMRTGRAELGEMFNVMPAIGALIVAGILTTLATYVGAILCIIPGIIVALGLSMTNPLIVDQQMSALDAMKESWSKMSGQLGGLFLLGIVLFLVNVAGLCACGLGLFVTYPLSIITFALVYRDMFLGGNITNVPQPPSNYPPIAAPR